MDTQLREQAKQSVRERVASLGEVALDLSHRIHAHPELAFEEHSASAALAGVLDQHGFTVTRGVADLPTALVGSAGGGELVVGLCAEYDALPEIGHACGHNVITAAAALAGMALAPSADSLGLTVKVFGTPAEERGGGKIIMLGRGVFDGVHAALMVHPTPHDMVRPTIAAHCGLDVEFFGETPPAMAPEQGRNAGAAATLLEVAVGLLRQSIRSTDRLAGYVRSAGTASNVMPKYAALSFSLRSATDERLAELIGQVRRCAEGAALATGTDVEIREHTRYGALRHHAGMGEYYRTNAERLGRVFPPVGAQDAERSASTDFGDVSARIPAIHPLVGIDAQGASNHQAAFTAYCAGPEGDRAVLDAGTALALTIVDIATDPDLRDELMAARP
ncbi:amidohydrolase [Dactylosporangium sp. CA-233914]|uniref:amidohydrolase n=1 Tax=Dactylosporangium sp. CA-233914 TaxID=3239934 RepID=UPI003D8ECBCA